jgi:tetratricopeptide (TPR) repeat protein
MALDREDLTRALRTLEGALSSGESPRVLAPLAEAQRLRGEIGEAIRTAERGIGAFPDHVGIRIVLARALVDAGRGDEAQRAYREVLDRDPGNFEAQAFLTPVERSVEPVEDERAAAPDEQARAESPGGLHEELADFANLFSARRSLDETSDERDPLSGIATITLAEIYARQGLFDRAVEVCETILERSPGNEHARAKLEEYRRELTAVG